MFRRFRIKTIHLIALGLVNVIILVNRSFTWSANPKQALMADQTVCSLDRQVEDNKPPRAVPPSVPEYERRRNIALRSCLGRNKSDWLNFWPHVKQVPHFRRSPMLSTKTKLFYCPVGKVASSFFTRWVLSMNKPGPMLSPYNIPIWRGGRGRAESLDKFTPKEKRLDFLQSATRVVFGRNPYSRIFSAYIDKLFSPNPFFWRYWAKIALKLDGALVEKCNPNATFVQFVRAVVENLGKRDVHLIPVTQECNVCEMPYDVVGKLESTVKDLDHASTLLNISSSFQHELQYKTQATKDILIDATHSAFSWKEKIKGCNVTLDEMGLRMWRKFQIRGVIDRSIDYPFQPGALEKMKAGQFVQACQDAISISTDKSRLKEQKTLAMKEAYSTVPQELVSKIQKMYDLDFSYFDYEKEPVYLTKDPKGISTYSKILQWEKPWL